MKRLVLAFCSLFFLATQGYSQKQLVILKNGHVRASFKEGEYLRFVLKKGHRHAEGHIVELNDFSMITSNDTVKFKDVLKINIKRHRGPARTGNGVGGFLFLGGIVYLAVDQLNVASGINAQNNTPVQWFAPVAAIGVGAAMIFIRPKYMRVNGIQYLQTVDYTSPFYQR
ncbi:MAG TPA: hypothetical protein VKQ08_10810 [Cyclobacteriaceae bacterium]|nr:hypothetical protein [Cyclobacteriaceae bacterium]